MNKIYVCGHLFFDNVFVLDSYPEENKSNEASEYSVGTGGVANFVRAFEKISKVPTDASNVLFQDAVILLNKSNGQRTSVVRWDDRRDLDLSSIEPNSWVHLMYLDRLRLAPEQLEALVKIGCTISADLCRHDHQNKQELLELIKHVKYLIASDIEIQDLKRELHNYAQYVIEHSPKQINMFSQDCGWEEMWGVDYDDKPKNTLGAGDFFAAHLVHFLMTDEHIPDGALYAMEETTKFVKGEL